MDPAFHDMFPLGEDDTPYRKLASDHVGTAAFDGQRVVTVALRALTELTRQAFIDCAHLLRPGHLRQLRAILDDTEASANDKFVAFDMLKNANIAAGKVLPMCQDTGTAIVMGKKGGPDRTKASRMCSTCCAAGRRSTRGACSAAMACSATA
jgi:fumarate hydratase, class I